MNLVGRSVGNVRLVLASYFPVRWKVTVQPQGVQDITVVGVKVTIISVVGIILYILKQKSNILVLIFCININRHICY